MAGKFITLEGGEGVGKSTNLHFVLEQLRHRGLDVVVTREPGGTPLAEELRNVLLSTREEPFDEVAELLVMFAARAQHIARVIRPALAAGKCVVSDRFTDATFAYQGYGRGVDLGKIVALESIVQGSLQPDLTIYLDMDVAQGLERVRARGERDRIEREQRNFFERVRAGYLSRVSANSDRFAVIDASQALIDVQKDIAISLEVLFGDRPA